MPNYGFWTSDTFCVPAVLVPSTPQLTVLFATLYGSSTLLNPIGV